MRNLIASLVVAFVAALSVFAFTGSAQAAGPNAATCKVGQSAPAYQDAALKQLNLSWTCDSQPGTGGFNLKPLGASKPVYFNKCIFRWQGAGFTKACKISVKEIVAADDNGKPAIILVTNKGNLLVTKGFFGVSVSKL